MFTSVTTQLRVSPNAVSHSECAPVPLRNATTSTAIGAASTPVVPGRSFTIAKPASPPLTITIGTVRSAFGTVIPITKPAMTAPPSAAHNSAR